MSTRIIQYLHRPNGTELGLTGTHDTYLLIKSDIDLHGLFPVGIQQQFIDVETQKPYSLKSAEGREFRVNQMGEFYRDKGLRPGDDIVIQKIITPEFVACNFDNLLLKYQTEIISFWYDEVYKWQAVQHFQSNWDIEADDFGAMFTEATKKHLNLLSSGNYFPIGMIQEFANADKERTRNMFRVLFDEERDLLERIKFFIDEAESIRLTGQEKWRNHYQDIHAISVYLTFCFPKKYFIYKYSELKNAVNRFGDDFSFEGKTTAEFYLRFMSYMEDIRSRITANKPLCEIVNSLISVSKNCYKDENFNITAVDLVYFVGKRLPDLGDNEIIAINHSKLFITAQRFDRVTFIKYKQGYDVSSIDILPDFVKQQDKYELEICWNGKIGTLLIKFATSERKRTDSPEMSDFYSLSLNGDPITDKHLVLTLGEINVLETFEKYEYHEIMWED